MARFTHLAREKDSLRILKRGIKARELGDGTRGVYAMPVLPNFFASHQWLRELRRFRSSPLVAVDFLIDDHEGVQVGHYSAAHASMTAAEASAVIMHAEDSRGYEVVIPRAITPKEIAGVRHVPQVVGWRYWPEAHGTPPCPCPVCQQATFGAARIRRNET
ncbi:hypothetical protein OJ998_18050 [Solirubrobacter taibaiensis]|nr:hypothetical protein [Solirubrobacter taibaiensis]